MALPNSFLVVTMHEPRRTNEEEVRIIGLLLVVYGCICMPSVSEEGLIIILLNVRLFLRTPLLLFLVIDDWLHPCLMIATRKSQINASPHHACTDRLMHYCRYARPIKFKTRL
jgi:hypothetical protein